MGHVSLHTNVAAERLFTSEEGPTENRLGELGSLCKYYYYYYYYYYINSTNSC